MNISTRPASSIFTEPLQDIDMLNIRTFTFNPFGERSSLVWDDTLEAVLIDPGCYDSSEVGTVMDLVREKGLTIKAIWLTHGHFDHIFGVTSFPGVPMYMHPADKDILAIDGTLASAVGLKEPDTSFTTVDIAEGDILKFGNTEFKVIATPGHTPGGVCFYDETDGVLFSGDTLFAGSIGRSDLPMGDYDSLIVSLMEKIMGLPGGVEVYPGHGPSTDIATERTHNPFLQPFNEPDQEYV